MPFKNIGLTVYLKAWDNDNQVWKTGYNANITPRGCGDGTMFTPAGSVSEISATYLPGLYAITFTDAENNYDVNAIGGSAADSTISIHGMEWLNLPIDFNTTQKASINTEADTALSDIKLDHLIASAESNDPVDNSIIAKLVSKDATADWSDYNNTTDSLEANRDNIGTAGANLTTEIIDAIKVMIIDGTITFQKAIKIQLAKDAGSLVVDGNTFKYYDQAGALILTEPPTLAGSTRVIS